MKFEYCKVDDVIGNFPGRPLCEENEIVLKMLEENEECVVFTYDSNEEAYDRYTVIVNYRTRKKLKVKVTKNGNQVIAINKGVIK